MTDKITQWLRGGDVAIQYQVHRDLLDTDKPELRQRIPLEGWGAALLSRRGNNGHWGEGFYSPKWTSTHYTLMDLKNLAFPPDNKSIKESLRLVLKHEKGADGGINPARTRRNSDVCVTGMVLNYASYFHAEQDELKSIATFLLSEHMSDGGFNCASNQRGATHSSLHTTLSVAEGILEYRRNGYSYKLNELNQAEEEAREFILQHRLYRSDKTGDIINKKFLRFPYPSRWYYDILKALDYFQSADAAHDKRMHDALNVLVKKRTKDGYWKLATGHPGRIHFAMEKPGTPSRWNTLRALRTLKHFKKDLT